MVTFVTIEDWKTIVTICPLGCVLIKVLELLETGLVIGLAILGR